MRIWIFRKRSSAHRTRISVRRCPMPESLASSCWPIPKSPATKFLFRPLSRKSSETALYGRLCSSNAASASSISRLLIFHTKLKICANKLIQVLNGQNADYAGVIVYDNIPADMLIPMGAQNQAIAEQIQIPSGKKSFYSKYGDMISL